METTTQQPQKQSSDLNIFAFWKAQQTPWKITVIRTSLERLGYKMLLPYLNLYIILMGATKTQLGFITSAGLILMALIGPALGNLIDTKGPKKAYIFGICVLIGSYLALGGARIWQVAALGLFLHQVGAGVGGASCASICGNCLASCDRAKGMLVCESLAAGLLGMVGPMISGWFLVNIMGVPDNEPPKTPEVIRPLFFIAVGITVISLLLVIFKLEDIRWAGHRVKKEKRSVLKDGMAILKADKNCRKWVLCAAISNVPYTMIVPYVQVFAAEVKGANTTELAAIATATALTSVICGYFVGILSDRYGRKKTMLATILLYMLGIVVLLVSKTPKLLIFVGLMSGFQEIGAPVSGAIQNELVPRQIIGRWQGVVRFFSSLFGAFLAAVAGIIYDTLGGQYVFIIYLACEAFLRIPLLLSLPETLTYKVDESKFADLMD